MKPFVTCLWYDSEAEQAATFYVSIFKNKGKMGNIARVVSGTEVHGRPMGSALTAEFELNGQLFVGLNGGPIFTPTEATSIQIMCDTQDEIDYFWDAFLAHGGKSSACGWLKDKWGHSWQITPSMLAAMISDPDAVKAKRAMDAMMKMVKLDIAALQKAYNG